MVVTQKEYQLLKEEIAELKILVAKLTRRVHELEEENLKLRTENNELKDRLGLNSSNSSLPSSRDLYKIKKEARQPSGKKPGGQKGHTGITRSRMVADQVITIKPTERYCSCGGAISLDKTPQIIQKIEIPAIKPDVTEYFLFLQHCLKDQNVKRKKFFTIYLA